MTAAHKATLATEAAAFLAAADVALGTVGFARLVRTVETSDDRPADPAMLETIAWAIRAAAHRLPIRATCLRRALAGAWMLKRRGVRPTLHHGVAKGGPRGFQAHAWFTASGIPVIGEREAEGFSLLATFPLESDDARQA